MRVRSKINCDCSVRRRCLTALILSSLSVYYRQNQLAQRTNSTKQMPCNTSISPKCVEQIAWYYIKIKPTIFSVGRKKLALTFTNIVCYIVPKNLSLLSILHHINNALYNLYFLYNYNIFYLTWQNQTFIDMKQMLTNYWLNRTKQWLVLSHKLTLNLESLSSKTDLHWRWLVQVWVFLHRF